MSMYAYKLSLFIFIHIWNGIIITDEGENSQVDNSPKGDLVASLNKEFLHNEFHNDGFDESFSNEEKSQSPNLNIPSTSLTPNTSSHSHGSNSSDLVLALSSPEAAYTASLQPSMGNSKIDEENSANDSNFSRREDDEWEDYCYVCRQGCDGIFSMFI